MERKPPKPHYHVTAGLIWKEGRLLITKRPPGAHLAGYWEFPGGKQEPREGLRECLKREIREELGIEVRVGRHFMTVTHEYPSKRITLHIFDCDGSTARPVTLEGQESLWVYPEDLSNFSFPPPDKRAIDSLKRKVRPKEVDTRGEDEECLRS